MRPKTLSASAFDTYLRCPKAFKVDYIDRVSSPSGDAANLGTACHEALENFIAQDHHVKMSPVSTLHALYTAAYYNHFADETFYEDGLDMMSKWHERMDFIGREVISTEKRENFPIKVKLPDGTTSQIPVTFIMDRLDLLEDGTPNVVDYKSIRENLSPEDLPGKIQARTYAVAAQMKYPEADGVWVTFDLLRYQPVGVYFSKEENRKSYLFIQQLAQSIVDDEKDPSSRRPWPEAKINVNCKYCTLRTSCDELLKYHDAGGMIGVNLEDLKEDERLEVIDRRARLKWAADALKYALEDLDGSITDYMVDTQSEELEGSATTLSIVGRSKYDVDTDLIRREVDASILADYAALGVTAVRKLIKDDERLSDEKRAILKKAITKRGAGRYLKSKDKGVMHE